MRKRVRAAALLAVVLTLAVPSLATAQPAGLPPLLQTAFFQDFETDTEGWLDAEVIHPGTGEPWYGAIERVASGTNGVTAASGDFFALVQGHPTLDNPYEAHTGPFSELGGYSSVWPGTWVTEVAVYIDPDAFAIGEGFDYAVAANGTDGAHQQDFVFNTAKQADGNYLIGFSNGTNFEPIMNLAAENHVAIDVVGWYIFQHVFEDDEGVLEVSLNVLNSDRLRLGGESHRYQENTIPDVVGGNRYGWFNFISLGVTLPVDHTTRQLPNTAFPVDFGALSARGEVVDGSVGVETIHMQGAIVTMQAGRARFDATFGVVVAPPIFGCNAITFADFTISFADGTSLTAAIDEDKWTNFGVVCVSGDSGLIAIVASVTSNTSGYTVLEQTIAFGIEVIEAPSNTLAFKGYFLNGPVPPPEFEMP